MGWQQWVPEEKRRDGGVWARVVVLDENEARPIDWESNKDETPKEKPGGIGRFSQQGVDVQSMAWPVFEKSRIFPGFALDVPGAQSRGITQWGGSGVRVSDEFFAPIDSSRLVNEWRMSPAVMSVTDPC